MTIKFGTNGADTIGGTAEDDQLYGYPDGSPDTDTGNDRITGGAGDDTIHGGGGDDTLLGQTGSDTILGGEGNDIINGGPGGGSSLDQLFGEGGNDTITGGDDDDVISGGDGDDTIFTGASSGNYFGWDRAYGGDGNDTITGGAGVQYLHGMEGEDWLYGGDDHDSLDSGLGIAHLDGGAGFDEGFVNRSDLTTAFEIDLSAGPGVLATANEGSTIVGIEHLTLFTGSGDDRITGGLEDDVFITGDGDDWMTGGAGQDYFEAGHGVDRMDGGADEDWAMIDRTDLSVGLILDLTPGSAVAVNASDGTQFINVEHVSVLGTQGNDQILGGSVLNMAMGEDGDDILTGGAGMQDLYGGDGDDTLSGGADGDWLDGNAGADMMSGGTGDDAYGVDDIGDLVNEAGNAGTDTVFVTLSTYVLPRNIENLIYTGAWLPGGGDFTGTGNTLANRITGDAGDDRLSGGRGADTLIGQGGDDTYVVDNLGDVIDESTGDGIDTVEATVTHVLAAGVENLVLFGAAATTGTGNELANTMTGNNAANRLYGMAGDDGIGGGNGDDTLKGGDGDDTLQGGGGDDTLQGEAGNDLLDGGAGNDDMRGGLGDDTYILDTAGDKVSEAGGGGIDTIRAGFAYTLANGFENLVITTSQAVAGTGNGAANTLTGGNGGNVLSGLGGADTIDGGGGADTLTGGTSNDIFVFVAGQADGDSIVDFTGNGASVGDRIRFTGYGAGTFVQIDATHWQVNSANGAIHEIITFGNATAVHASDYTFV